MALSNPRESCNVSRDREASFARRRRERTRPPRRHCTTLHWDVDEEALHWLRRDQSQVILEKGDFLDIKVVDSKPECIFIHLIKDGKATTRTFSLEPKLRVALLHILNALVFPDRETASTRNLVQATVVEAKDNNKQIETLRRRAKQLPRHSIMRNERAVALAEA